ncbi:MAG: CBASS cGAMP-activated phospholipase [Candidatus Sulfotelmatobacter sp.]
MSRFRILSIDGGGIKGVFPAAFLAAVEDTLGGAPISEFFDLIAGTSTGGIIALGLGLGLRAGDVLGFYEQYGPRIFPKRPIWSWLGSARYDAQPLKEALEKTFGSKRLGDAKRRLLIPSFNATTGRIHIYKTAHHPRLQTDFKELAVSVALATSAAPVYLPAFRSGQEVVLIDGGIWANNPVGLAVVEAISMLGKEGTELDVLSIGCTAKPPDFTQRGRGLLFWARRALDAAMDGQAFGALGTAQHLAGHENVLRFNPVVMPGRFALDNVQGIRELKALGYSEARESLRQLTPKFFSSQAEEFHPLCS